MLKIVLLFTLLSVSIALADEPAKRYEMWDTDQTPTSHFQLCRELLEILNHPINAERVSWLPDRLFKIPPGYDNFKHIKWTSVPREEWDRYYDEKNPEGATSLYSTILPEGEKQILEKAYYDADHYQGSQWMFRYKVGQSWKKPSIFWRKPIVRGGGGSQI